MRFAVINDTHLGPAQRDAHNDFRRTLVHQSEGLIKKVVNHMNSEYRPEFVVHLGDVIDDVGHKKIDMNSLKKAVSLLSQLSTPVYYLVGNHDVKSFTQEEAAKVFGYEKMYYSFDHGSYHFIALSFTKEYDSKTKQWGPASIERSQLEWLKEDLATTKKPTIIFSHHGLADDDMAGNYYFENNPDAAVIKNRVMVRGILEKSGKVKAVISGHQHWNRMRVHSLIPYFTVTSMVENFNNDGIAAEAYTIVELDGGKIKINVKGNDPAEFGYKFKTNPMHRLLNYLHIKT